jgi:hypothetical protein
VGLTDAIGAGPVALDTVAFIYFIEEHPRFLPILLPVFESIDSQRLPAVASSLTLLEVLVVPYRSGNVALAERYEEILTGSRGLRLLDIDRPQLRGCTSAALHVASPMQFIYLQHCTPAVLAWSRMTRFCLRSRACASCRSSISRPNELEDRA